jgi:putative pyruvate formate lyase activating enzyme
VYGTRKGPSSATGPGWTSIPELRERAPRDPPRPAADFVLDGHEPAYRRLHREGRLGERAAAAIEELRDCQACPRNCRCDRLKDERRACHTGRHAIVSSAFAHHGEEDCLRGWRGSGTIFFGLCNLRCVFCQNGDISQRRQGRECTAEEIADTMLELQGLGCHNVNLVTPEHVVPQVIEAVAVAAERGLRLPLVYNTGGYDALRSLRLLDGIVDVYMPDFKFWRPETARRLCLARDYPERAREAVLEMHRQVGPLRFDRHGLARRGMLVRHLVMPGQQAEAAGIFDWLAREVSADTYVNVMGQYHPDHRVGVPTPREERPFAEVDRRPCGAELEAALAAARGAGLWRFDERHRLSSRLETAG